MRCKKLIGLAAAVIGTTIPTTLLSSGSATAGSQQCNSGPVPIASNTNCSSEGGGGSGGGSGPNSNSSSSSSSSSGSSGSGGS